MSRELLDLSTKRESEPAKRWRNWWRAKVTGYGICDACGKRTLRLPGSVFDACCTPSYPSKDVAESEARLNESPECVEHIGAYPEGSRPDV